MKLIASLIVIFLIVCNEDLETSNSIAAAAQKITRKHDINWYIQRLTKLTQDFNLIAIHSLLNENSIDGYDISKEILGLPYQLDFENIHLNSTEMSKKLHEHVEGLKSLPMINADSLRNATKALKILQDSRTLKQIDKFRELLNDTILSLFKTIGSLKRDEPFSKIAKVTKEVIEFYNEADSVQSGSDDGTYQQWKDNFTELYDNAKHETKGWHDSLIEEPQKIRMLFANIIHQSFPRKFTRFFEKLDIIGDRKTYENNRKMLPTWNETAINIDQFIRKLAEMNKTSDEYKQTMSLLKYIKHPKSASGMMIMVGFLDNSFESIHSDNETIRNFLSAMRDLVRNREILKNFSTEFFPDPEEIDISTKYFLENDKTVIEEFTRIHMYLSDWKHREPKKLKRGIERFERDLMKIKESMNQVFNISETLLTTLNAMSLQFLTTDTLNDSGKYDFIQSVHRNLSNEMGPLKKNQEILTDCSNTINQMSILKNELDEYYLSLNISELNSIRLQDMNFELVEKLISFSSSINKIDSKKVANVSTEVFNTLALIRISAETVQETCIELSLEKPTVHLDSPTQIVWQLNNGLKVIQVIRLIRNNKTKNHDSDEYEMAMNVEKSIENINSTKYGSSLINPFLEARKFRAVLTEKKKRDIDWIRFYEYIDGAIEAFSKFEQLNGNEANDTEKGYEENVTLSEISMKSSGISYPFIIPIVLLSIVIFAFSSKVMFDFVRKRCCPPEV